MFSLPFFPPDPIRLFFSFWEIETGGLALGGKLDLSLAVASVATRDLAPFYFHSRVQPIRLRRKHANFSPSFFFAS